MIEVAHVITGLDLGGAEVVLLRLLEGTDRKRFKPRVLSLGSGGVIADAIREQGVELTSVGLGRLMAGPLALARTVRWLKTANPRVVQTWMYQADLIGGFASRIGPRSPVVWGLHATEFPSDQRSLLMRAGLFTAARASSRLPARIICCAQASKEAHSAMGYDTSKMVVIPNGFEVSGSQVSRTEARKILSIREDALVIARVGRAHPQKDHGTLFAAGEKLIRDGLDVELVLVGRDMEQSLWASTLSLHPQIAGRVRFLGQRNDIDLVYAAADVSVSSSAFGEAFPLVLGESMARATPVVATDVGDSAFLVGAPDRVVPPHDPVALAAALRRVLELTLPQRAALGARDRDRIEKNFGLQKMVDAYEAVYESVAKPL